MERVSSKLLARRTLRVEWYGGRDLVEVRMGHEEVHCDPFTKNDAGGLQRRNYSQNTKRLTAQILITLLL
jgi:hypothetical protein